MLPVVSETVLVQLALNTQLIFGALTSTTVSGCAPAATGSSANIAHAMTPTRIAPSRPLRTRECGPDLRSTQDRDAACALRRGLHLMARRRLRDFHLVLGHVGRDVGKQWRRKIALAGIRQHAQDRRSLRRVFRDLQRAREGAARRDADENA